MVGSDCGDHAGHPRPGRGIGGVEEGQPEASASGRHVLVASRCGAEAWSRREREAEEEKKKAAEEGGGGAAQKSR